jgi:hypothetical protein
VHRHHIRPVFESTQIFWLDISELLSDCALQAVAKEKSNASPQARKLVMDDEMESFMVAL